MAISHEGASISMNIKALNEGEGFVVTFSANLGNTTPRNARNKASDQGITGQRLNVHRDTLADAQSTLESEITDFASELTTFITEWNEQQN